MIGHARTAGDDPRRMPVPGHGRHGLVAARRSITCPHGSVMLPIWRALASLLAGLNARLGVLAGRAERISRSVAAGEEMVIGRIDRSSRIWALAPEIPRGFGLGAVGSRKLDGQAVPYGFRAV